MFRTQHPTLILLRLPTLCIKWYDTNSSKKQLNCSDVKKKKKAHQMMCKNEINSKSLKSTWKTFQCLQTSFRLSPETFSLAFILRSLLSTFSMSLPVLSLFCQTFWRMIIVVKTKRQLRSKSIVSLACLARALFAVELIFSTYGYRNEK